MKRQIQSPLKSVKCFHHLSYLQAYPQKIQWGEQRGTGVIRASHLFCGSYSLPNIILLIAVQLVNDASCFSPCSGGIAGPYVCLGSDKDPFLSSSPHSKPTVHWRLLPQECFLGCDFSDILMLTGAAVYGFTPAEECVFFQCGNGKGFCQQKIHFPSKVPANSY